MQVERGKGRTIPLHREELRRLDHCGNIDPCDRHGNREAEFGWEIDRDAAVGNIGRDGPFNLRPLQRRAHAERQGSG